MDFLSLARNRKSTRAYKNTEVSNEDILRLLEAARQAPSGGNCQPWHFFVVKSQRVRERIYEESYPSKWIRSAPLMIVVCADILKTEAKYGERGRNMYSLQDTAAAIQNILLCAEDIGLSACWCGAFDLDSMKEILKLETDMRPVALIPIGYAKTLDIALKPTRKTIEEISTFID